MKIKKIDVLINDNWKEKIKLNWRIKEYIN